jgi:hypothetical protein
LDKVIFPFQGASFVGGTQEWLLEEMKSMVNKILQLLSIRCSHKKMSQPFAAAVASGRRAVNSDWDMPAPAGQHYVVCLDCGHKFEYDWANMRVID